MELGKTIIQCMGKAANRWQPNAGEDAEHDLPHQALRQASLSPTRAEPMDQDSKWEGRNFVQLCKTSLASPTSDARSQSKALWTLGVPAVAQEPELLTFT